MVSQINYGDYKSLIRMAYRDRKYSKDGEDDDDDNDVYHMSIAQDLKENINIQKIFNEIHPSNEEKEGNTGNKET